MAAAPAVITCAPSNEAICAFVPVTTETLGTADDSSCWASVKVENAVWAASPEPVGRMSVGHSREMSCTDDEEVDRGIGWLLLLGKGGVLSPDCKKSSCP